MKYLLDSNTISALYDPEALCNDRISAHVSALDDGDCLYISILSVYELECGGMALPSMRPAFSNCQLPNFRCKSISVRC